MSEDLVFDVPENVEADTLVDEAKYHEMYAESLRDPGAFWGEHGKRIDWMRPYTKVKNTLYSKEDVSIKWYEDGTLNACVNCVDRHLDARGDDIAIIWEGDEPDQAAKITYCHMSQATRARKYELLVLSDGSCPHNAQGPPRSLIPDAPLSFRFRFRFFES